MMKVVTYLINLDGSQERLERATQQLNQVNWPFERFSAVDGRGKALTEFANYDDQGAKDVLGRKLMNSELGCYLSHYGCAEKFLSTDADYLVVLEDDMKINQDFKNKLDGLIEYLDQHKELDWYLINIATKKKKLAKDITNINGMSVWHAFYFPIRGLGLWPALVKPAGLDSDILGTVAEQGISRKEKEGRSLSHGIKKQKRMWRDKFYAMKHLVASK